MTKCFRRGRAADKGSRKTSKASLGTSQARAVVHCRRAHTRTRNTKIWTWTAWMAGASPKAVCPELQTLIRAPQTSKVRFLQAARTRRCVARLTILKSLISTKTQLIITLSPTKATKHLSSRLPSATSTGLKIEPMFWTKLIVLVNLR